MNRSKELKFFQKLINKESLFFRSYNKRYYKLQSEINRLKPINVEELLGREPIPADPNLLKKAIEDKIICVTVQVVQLEASFVSKFLN